MSPLNREILAVEAMLTADERRVSVSDHEAFRESISVCPANYDEIDDMLDERIEIDPYVSGASNRRSDKDLAHMLDLIDNLPISDQGKEGTI